MLCSSCRTAGKYLRENLPDMAEVCHSKCPGGTWCTCQHKLRGVNWLLVDDAGVPIADPRRGG